MKESLYDNKGTWEKRQLKETFVMKWKWSALKKRDALPFLLAQLGNEPKAVAMIGQSCNDM